MDFKARFEGKKSFINKRGDIVDPQSKQVTTLRKPMQQNAQQNGNPGATQQQPYMMFMNHKALQETQ